MSYEPEGAWEVWRETEHTARKEHTCNACGERIQPGQKYGVTFTVYDGSAQTVKRCSRCDAIYDHLNEINNECDRCIAIKLDCGETYEDEWGDMPVEAQELAFLLPGEQPGALIGDEK